jgi:hypothetical protein
MNRKEIESSEKQQQAPSSKRQNFLDKYGGAPLAFIMRNPKMTPIILLVLAVVPFVITTFVLALVFLWQ